MARASRPGEVEGTTRNGRPLLARAATALLCLALGWAPGVAACHVVYVDTRDPVSVQVGPGRGDVVRVEGRSRVALPSGLRAYTEPVDCEGALAMSDSCRVHCRPGADGRRCTFRNYLGGDAGSADFDTYVVHADGTVTPTATVRLHFLKMLLGWVPGLVIAWLFAKLLFWLREGWLVDG